MSLSLFKKKKICKFFARCCIIMLYYFLATEASSEIKGYKKRNKALTFIPFKYKKIQDAPLVISC